VVRYSFPMPDSHRPHIVGLPTHQGSTGDRAEAYEVYAAQAERPCNAVRAENGLLKGTAYKRTVSSSEVMGRTKRLITPR
jgi:hypothetical protein